MRKKKKTKRDNIKYKNLDKSVNLKSRKDLIDYDYLDKLSESELEWLDKFTGEFVGASLDTERPRRNLHKTKAQRKQIYDMNNARNRDILNRSRSKNNLEDLKKVTKSEQDRLDARIQLQMMGVIDDDGKLIKKKI